MPGAPATRWLISGHRSSPPALSSKDDNAARRIGLSPPDNDTAMRVSISMAGSGRGSEDDSDLMMKVVGDHAPARGLPVKLRSCTARARSTTPSSFSGEIDMMLDETTVHVKAGDVVIQQATNHAWVNRGTQPCRILFVLMDSKQP